MIIIRKNKNGFTLIELLVVMAVFALMILLVVGIFLTLTSTQRKLAATMQTESDIRYVLEYIAQEIRGSAIDYEYYYTGELSVPTDYLILRHRNHDQVRFRFNSNTTQMCTCTYDVDADQCFSNNGCSVDGSTERWSDITTSKVQVNNLQFYITPTESPFGAKKPCQDDDDCDYGDCSDDLTYKYCLINPNEQPKVTIVIAAESAQEREAEKENIFLQTTISSRQYFR